MLKHPVCLHKLLLAVHHIAFKGYYCGMQVMVRRLFEKLGATYIKLGQFIASSPTLFPEEYVLEFQKCLDKTDPVPWEVIKRTIDRELGIRADEIFSQIDPQPIATASVAQVHAAGKLSEQAEQRNGLGTEKSANLLQSCQNLFLEAFKP